MTRLAVSVLLLAACTAPQRPEPTPVARITTASPTASPSPTPLGTEPPSPAPTILAAAPLATAVTPIQVGRGSGSGGYCLASYYGRAHAGRRTASGSRFDPSAMTAAHRSLPFGTVVLVSYAGRSVRVAVTDRGPFVDTSRRCLDLSEAAMSALGGTSRGVIPVRWEVA